MTVPETKDIVPEIVASAGDWIRRALGADDMPFEVISMLPWRRTQLTAASYRKGRVILVGDSAHTMSPTGGLGMNTGMGDVNNLGWKLAAMVSSWGGEDLIASYEVERRPVALRNANASTHNYNQLKSAQDCAALYEEPLVLVRPDGHVAWCGEAVPEDCDVLIAHVTGHSSEGLEAKLKSVA